MSKKVLCAGDIIKYNDKEYVVIKNYGASGLIKENCPNGALINGFRWNHEKNNYIYIKSSEKELDIINSASNEFENFFENYNV